MSDITITGGITVPTSLPQLDKMKIRAIKIVLTLQIGEFPDSNGSNTKSMYSCSLQGYLEIDCALQLFPNYMGNTALVNIYGMLDSDCFAAMKYNVDPLYQPWYNSITISAGYITPQQQTDGTYLQTDVKAAIDNLPIVFQGEILSAAPNFNDVNRPFIINSVSAFQASNVIIASTSLNNSTTVSGAVQSMITTWNNTSNSQYQYQLGGIDVDTIINNGHFIGSFIQQLNKLCQDYNYQYRQVFSTTTPNVRQIFLSQIGNVQQNTNPQILSNYTGMIGYPEVLPLGILVKEYFNPARNLNDRIFLSTYVTPLSDNYYNVWQVQSLLSTRQEEWESVLTLLNVQNYAGQ
jgi:hypothetical protein